MTNYIVTIGRNVGDEPMDDDKWREFQDRVRYAIAKNGYEFITQAVGHGYWEDTVEDSAIWVFTGGEGKAYQLHTELGHLAYYFEQDAIAWQEVASPKFIRP